MMIANVGFLLSCKLSRFIFPTGVIFVVWKTMIQLSFFQHAFSMVVNPCVLCCNISHPNLFCPD